MTIHTPLVLDCPHSQRNPALPCVSFTLSCVSVCFSNIHTTRPCDLRGHAHSAARSPVNHWPAPATPRRPRCRGSNLHLRISVSIYTLVPFNQAIKLGMVADRRVSKRPDTPCRNCPNGQDPIAPQFWGILPPTYAYKGYIS